MADRPPPALNHALQNRLRLGKYAIQRLVGRGAMADVYLARDPGLELDVAIKVIHAGYASDPAFISRFRQEARTVANLNHPNIVRVFSFDDEAGLYYLVMRYIPGDTLATRLYQTHSQGRFLSWAAVCDIMQGLCSAVGYAHRKQMIHRDIKPSNVMFDDDDSPDTPVLTDFGVAKIVNTTAVTNSQALTGTPLYMSPEQARSEEVTGRSDIYSLGVMLYEMATGTVPFQGDNMWSILYQHWEKAPPVPSTRNARVPPALDAVILRALDKDPSLRYPTADAFAAAIRQAVPADDPAPSISPPAVSPTDQTLAEAPPTPASARPKGQPTTTLVDRPPSGQAAGVDTRVTQPHAAEPHAAESAAAAAPAAPTDEQPRASAAQAEAPGAAAGVGQAPDIAPPTRPRVSAYLRLVGEGGWEVALARAHHVTLGRAVGNRDQNVDVDLRPLDPNRTISRQHAQILMPADGCYVRDLQSRNGIAVNGQAVPPRGRRRLDDGDILTLGDVRLTVHLAQKTD